MQQERDIDRVLAFWFGDSSDLAEVIDDRNSLWFAGSEELDQDIRQQFISLVERARAGELHGWEEAPQGSLALLLLLDQFTRNIYRNSEKAFACDSLARDICYRGLENAFDRKLSFSQRLFYYMPLEHSEMLGDQRDCVKLFESLRDDVIASFQQRYHAMFQGYVDFAVRHYDIIAQFGRFPHRNAVLGRQSTPDEMAYLKNGGDTFGQ